MIIKRDVDVDAAIETVPELSDALLGYLDFRNANDSEYKKGVLLAIYDYLEPNRSLYKSSSCKQISEEFFACMNNFRIRHNTDSQIDIPEEQKVEVYDKLFKMGLYVLRTPEVDGFKNEMKSLREQ